MYISRIHITSFGKLENVDIELSDGINILEGSNESGKTTAAMFIKFVLYGAGSGKSRDSSLISDKKRYISWESGSANGYIVAECENASYKIERVSVLSTDASGRESYREAVKMIDLATNNTVYKGEVPGEVLFGVPEDMFMNTAFVRQADASGTKKPDASASSAIENIMFSADETVDTKKALEKLDSARKMLLHKNGAGGEIYELEEETAILTKKLGEVQTIHSEVIAVEGSLADLAVKSAQVSKRYSRARNLCAVWDVRSKLRWVDTLVQLKEKHNETARKIQEIENRYKSIGVPVPDKDTSRELRECAVALDELNAEIRDVEIEYKNRYFSQSHIVGNKAGLGNGRLDSEKKERILNDAHTHQMRRSSFTGIGAVLLIIALIAALGVLFVNMFAGVFVYFALISAGLFLVAAVLCFKMSSNEKRALLQTFREWGVDSIADLESALDLAIEVFAAQNNSAAYEADLTDRIDHLNEYAEYAIALLEQAGMNPEESTAYYIGPGADGSFGGNDSEPEADSLTTEPGAGSELDYINKISDMQSLSDTQSQTPEEAAALHDDEELTYTKKRGNSDNFYSNMITDIEVSRIDTNAPAPSATVKYDVHALIITLRKFEGDTADFCVVHSELLRDLDMTAEKAKTISEQSAPLKDEPELRLLLRELLSDEYVAANELKDANAVQAMKQERDFSEKALASLSAHGHELEKRYASLTGALHDDPAVIAAKIDENEKRLSELRKNLGAYKLAYDILSDASENLIGNVAPNLTDYARKIMATISSDKYQDLSVDSKLDMTFNQNGLTTEVDYLSAGTKDIAYVSLRLALAELIYENERPPLIFDESFARLDDSRLARMLDMLSAAAKNQILILTCHRRESAILSDSDKINVIEM